MSSQISKHNDVHLSYTHKTADTVTKKSYWHTLITAAHCSGKNLKVKYV